MRPVIECPFSEKNKPVPDKMQHSIPVSASIFYRTVQLPRIGRAKDAKTAMRHISIDTAQ